ncbi:hypothetical protein [Azospirillum brasilense]|uniref:hypothetical protein n=1 Tax=Azospirillum brasilense TaxID=192 RepID=UPI000E6A8533|nr:hypothetical protein [Azospirillum brasilense]NUB23350.1 hypothetical protein [Azospirillum brasilense]NUB30972.1 hypothetical protein [Azospirillum brasilense]RIW05647.1 hypothetical protein D2T81_07320 [Azospirillum brasilense]
MSSLHDDDEDDDDLDELIDVDEPLDLDDDPYAEEETPLEELEPEELIAITEEEGIVSDVVDPLKDDVAERDRIQKEIDRLKGNLEEVNNRIDDRSRDLTEDIKTHRDEVSTPSYGPDEISDEESNKYGH